MRSQHVKSSSIPFPLPSSVPMAHLHSTPSTHYHGNRILTDQPVKMASFYPAVNSSIHSAQIANIATATWLNIYIALSPIIGQKGVAAIYKRSLSLARRDYPWLMYAQECTRSAGDFTSLRTTLARQPIRVASAAHRSLLGVFYNLVRHLIGNELTEKLLQHVRDHDLNG
jgi:hypothetical protein